MFSRCGNLYYYCFITTRFMVSLGPRNNSFGFSAFSDFAMNPFRLSQEWNSVAKDEDVQGFLKTETSSLGNE